MTETKPTADLKQALVDHVSNPEFVRQAAIEGAQDQNDMLARATAEVSVDIVERLTKDIYFWVAQESNAHSFEEGRMAREGLKVSIQDALQAHTTALKGRIKELEDKLDEINDPEALYH